MGHLSILRNGCAVLDLHNNVLQWYGSRWTIQQHEFAGFESIVPLPPKIGNASIDKLVRRNADIFSAKGEPLGEVLFGVCLGIYMCSHEHCKAN